MTLSAADDVLPFYKNIQAQGIQHNIIFIPCDSVAPFSGVLPPTTTTTTITTITTRTTTTKTIRTITTTTTSAMSITITKSLINIVTATTRTRTRLFLLSVTIEKTRKSIATIIKKKKTPKMLKERRMSTTPITKIIRTTINTGTKEIIKNKQ